MAPPKRPPARYTWPMVKARQETLINAVQDVGLIGLSIVAALLLARSGALHEVLTSFGDVWILGAFVAGIFFTSIFTTAPAVAVILLISQDQSVWLVALVAALGSLIGDFVMFWFARDRLSYYLKELMKRELRSAKASHIFHLHVFRWIALVLGALVIASPLPDELGIALLGLARVSSNYFAPLSFVANFVGILFIGYLATGAL